MAITTLDLKLRQSERMTDNPDGGGRMSAVEVRDGLLNNVFPDLSDADGIIGNVVLREIFLHVATANTDPYLKPFFFLTDLPQNDNVSVCIFDLNRSWALRSEARNYYEGYRARGVKSQFVLYGDHFGGQRTIQVYCRAEIASPDIGDVFCLSIEKAGYTPALQYVKVEEVALRTTTTFTDTQGDFQRDVLMIKLTSALAQDFPGQEDPQRLTGVNNPPTLVRKTNVADSARYYGVKACIVPPQAGDSVIRVDTPYIPVVPATQSEAPVVDQIAGLGSRAFVECSAPGALTYSGNMTGAANVAVPRYFGTPYAPGTLDLTVGSVALRDDGSGGLTAVDPVNTGWSGEANYSAGSFAIARDIGFSGTVVATATAAGLVVQQSFSRAIPITAANRNISHVFQLPGQPAPGSAVLDYLALGKWIRLTDTGRGRLAGNPGEGSATINYASGSVAVTLGALPDIDSALIVSWGTDLRARDSHGEITIPAPTLRQQLAHPGAMPGTLMMTWKSGGADKTASAAASGAITGDATGNFDCTAGVVEFTTAFALDPGEQFHYAYSYVDAGKVHSEVFTPTAAGGAVSLTLAHAAAQRSVVAAWSVIAPSPGGGDAWRRSYAVIDDGAGGFTVALPGVNSIDYASGAIILRVE